MKIYDVEVNARKLGAIGIFYKHSFVLSGPSGLKRKDILERWHNRFGSKYELYNIISFKEREAQYT